MPPFALRPALRSNASAPDWTGPVFGGLAVGLGALAVALVLRLPNPLYALALPVAIVIALATLMRVEWGMLTLIFFAYVRLSDVLIKFHNTPSLADPLIVWMMAVIALRWLFLNERPRGWERAALAMGAYGVLCLASLLWAKDSEAAQTAVFGFVKDALVGVLAVITLQSTASLRRVVWVLLAAGMMLGTLSALQQITGQFSNNYGGFAQAGIDTNVGQTANLRAAGSVGDPNFYAQIMVVLVPLAADRFWNETTAWRRGVAAYALVVSVIAILATYSRGGFVALLVVTALLLIRRPPSVPVLMVTITLGLSLMPFLPPNYLARINTLLDVLPGLSNTNTLTDVSFRGRLSENTAALLMFRDHPLLGVGFNNYESRYQEYSRTLGLDNRVESRKPHSLYLQIVSEFGLLGVGVLGTLLTLLFLGLHRAETDLRRANLVSHANIVGALLIAMAGYLTAAIFLHNAYARFFWLLFAIAFTVPSVARNEILRQQTARPAERAA
jgi:putative inorganic carbon (HCO3(-)) transporter